MHAKKSITANIRWQDKLPYSTDFDDIYFSSDDGLLETNYVFINANQLPERFQNLDNNAFTIIETGFGTGLNFLCAVHQWLQHTPKQSTMHFISIEKYPLSLSDLTKSLAIWPSLSTLSAQLVDAYATIHFDDYPQCITLTPMHGITLTLHLGDINHCIHAISQKADAWFLDGFAPAKNPDMWQATLFDNMRRLSHAQTTFATFTSAGIVKRGLAAAGFIVKKQVGFGKKREMLLGQYGGAQP